MFGRGVGLLVSVRSAAEAEEALAGGADLIDVKEPSRGALGRADDGVVAEVLARVAGRRPVSAALGELTEFLGTAPAGCAYVKWGLAGMTRGWQSRLESAFATLPAGRGVVVGYADWQCAQAPPLHEVAAYACRRPGAVLLVDTHCKDLDQHGRRASLLDWVSLAELAGVVKQVHGAGGRVALAGSLSATELVEVAALRPDWVAVRGAACLDNDRQARVCRERVRRLKASLGPV